MRVLIFGSSGALGNCVLETFESHGWETVGTSREISNQKTVKIGAEFESQIAGLGPFDAVVFAQGKNTSDSIDNTSKLAEILEANLTSISTAVEKLLRTSSFSDKARVTIIGSVWQGVSRVNKFSYSVSKSALQGLMNSMVADLSSLGISTNIVAPGVVDTPMTRANLKSEQIERVIAQTPIGKLVTPNEVASLVYWLSSPLAEGINGQTIRIDNGWSNVRFI